MATTRHSTPSNKTRCSRLCTPRYIALCSGGCDIVVGTPHPSRSALRKGYHDFIFNRPSLVTFAREKKMTS